MVYGKPGHVATRNQVFPRALITDWSDLNRTNPSYLRGNNETPSFPRTKAVMRFQLSLSQIVQIFIWCFYHRFRILNS